MVSERLTQYSLLALVCALTSYIYIRFWQPSIAAVALLNALVIAFCVPPYIAWNFFSLKSMLVRPPLATDTEFTEETSDSRDDAIRERDQLVLETPVTRLRKLEIEDQASPLVFGELLPKGCDEPRLIAETSRTLCLTYAESDSVTLVKIIRMTDEAWRDGAVNEIFISRALQELRKKGGAHRTNGFCRRKLAVFVRDYIPLQILLARQREYSVLSDLKDHFFSQHGFHEMSDFLYFEYRSGGEYLMNVRFQSIKQVFSAIAQVVFTIAVAESALEFEHRHLEMDSIMVSTTHETHVEFCLKNRTIWLSSCGIVTRIGNLGKARARLGNSTYYSNLVNRFADPVFAGDACWFGYGFAIGQLNSDWSQYKPVTNVMYMAQMLGDLVFNLEHESEFTRSEMCPLLELRYALLTMKYASMVSVMEDCREFKNIIP